MATTRAATFTSKIRNLKDYHSRIINNVIPQPTGVDAANTLKYFSQTLLSILKDVPNIPAESYGPRQRDSVRLSIFPNLNYSGLYHAVLNMIDLVPIVQIGQLELGEAVLNVLGCLVPFLEHELLDSLPYMVASTLAIFPPTLHKDTIDLLCSNLLPMTLGFDGCVEPSYASESAAAIITMVFQHTDNGSYHSQILECFMSIKRDIIKDILSIIAYGPPSARAPAANLLFYYWPQLNPSLSDRRGIHYKYSAWPPVLCQRENCVNSGNCQAVKMCLNPALAIHSRDKPPPLYICSDCADVLRKDHSEYMMDILLPMSHVSTICENKNCKSKNNTTLSTCFSIECASSNGNRPIRYCQSCHEAHHASQQGIRHVYHLSIPVIWSCTPEMQRYLMDAIISLLKEAQPLESKRSLEMGEELRHRIGEEDDMFEVEDAGERKLLSRYGIWLLVELCKPKDDIPIEILGRLLGMLFQWFDATAYLPDDNVGNALERLKSEYITNWLKEVNKSHLEVIVSCLLPHPVEYARVGGFWDTLATRTTQIKEGLNCFFCLVPYDIITFQIWDYVMPYWMETIRTEVPTEELPSLRVLLSKAFDIDMCPLPFMLDKMYHFVDIRFQDPSAYVQEQALQWLQILSKLDIILPVHICFSMFQHGIQHLQKIEKVDHGPRDPNVYGRTSPVGEYPPPLSPEKLRAVTVETYEIYDREADLVLPCYIMMLDIILKQLELQECAPHLGIYNETSKELMRCLTSMLSVTWEGEHTCGGEDEGEGVNCIFCQNIALWHQLASQIIKHFSPRDPVKIPVQDIPKVEEIKSVLAPLPKEMMVGDKESTERSAAAETVESSEVEFNTAGMPVHLQLFHSLLKELETLTDVDALYSLLTSMKYLILHGECLNYSINQYPEFVKHCLVKRLIPTLWKLFQARHSQLACVAVPLLLHCQTLPNGADALWKIVEADFSHEDWRARFSAVEKACVLARLADTESVHHNRVIQTALAHIFCLLIGSLEDINGMVAQRTIQNLETIKISSVKCLCQCLEFQFDTVIGDRIMILQRMHLLNNVFPQANILSWEFFLSRFDTLSLEAQLDLESTGDITCPTDLTSSDKESENFLRKLNRARFALARTDSIRSVSSSLSGKPPYRRAVSVPMHLLTKSVPPKGQRPRRLTHPDTSLDFGKDKAYIRQQSAPQFRLRRQGTKFNLASFTNSMFPGGQLKEFTDEESNFAALLQRAMDLEGVDRETVYMLVSLLMKYMVKCEDKSEDKDASKAQNIVLRHLNVLLGYNQTEKSFSVPPHRLRSSAVFNSFLSGIPFVLDRNFKLGNTILPITLLLLQYGPSPQRYASDYQPPNYTLWYLEPHTRVSWLNTLLVILYKYQIDTSPVSAIVQILVRIVVNTIEAQHHRCKTSHEDGFPPPSPTVHRSKDWTKISASDLENIEETETPPQSPTSLESVKVHLSAATDGATVQYNKKPDTIPEERKTTNIQETPLRRPVRPKRAPRKLVHYSEEDAGTESNGEQTPTDSEQKMSQSISMEEKMAEQIKEFEIKGDYGKMSKAQTGAEVVRSTDSPTDASKESTVTTGQTESSKDGMSEVDSVMDDSEKTQTSEADSERNQANDDSAGDAAHEGDTEEKNPHSTKGPIKPNFRQRKARKTGLTTVELQKIFPELAADSSNGGREEEISSKTKMGRRSRRSEMIAKAQAAKKQVPHGRCGENTLMERCTECNAVLEQYDDDTIGLCIVVLSTFIHREPSLATPMLLEILLSVSRIASCSPYTWQTDCSIMVPGSTMSIARQFLRCCLHQLAPNGIFPMLFQSNLDDTQFLKTMAAALIDFSELPCHAPIHFLLEGLNNRKNLSSENIMQLLNNLATYMNCNLDSSTSSTMWTNIINEFDTFLRRLSDILPTPCDMTPILKIITSLLKVMGISNAKFILEPFAKLISIGIQHCSFKLTHVLDICSLCNRVFNKERDKLYLTRTVIFQLVQAMRFKTSLPDENFLLLVQFVVLDAGGTICSSNIVADIGTLYNTHAHMLMSTCAAECMRQYLSDCMEFVGDLHTINNVKTNMKGGNCSMNEDTLGGQIKSGVAQFIALEITRGNGRDNRAISRYLPWLYHPPSTTQQGPKEFTDCIGHIGLLSWLLIGSLTHTAMTEGAAPITCMPIPLDASTYVAEHVLVILTGFAEESKNSVLHMSSLFHAFFLCQLWTMYCESAAAQYSPNSDQHQSAMTTIMDFWGRVTPGILQLLSHSKVLAEMVNLHFLSLMEALQECNSSVLAKLFPMWTSILYAYHGQLPGHLHVRLQNCHNWKPPTPTSEENFINSNILLTWLKRIQFKLGQIEVQSSAATQFYTV